MADLAAAVAALAARVARLEDELAIHRLLVAYGLAADRGDATDAAATFTPDGVYDVDVGRMEGPAAVTAMLAGDRHQGMVGRCAHQIGPAVLTRLDGDVAEAVGYSRVYLAEPDGVRIYRVSVNRWELRRTADGWRIARRTTRLLGHAEALAVLGA